MYRIEKSRKHFWRNMFARMALVLVTVAVIVWSLPRNESQRFRYDVGKPWMYGSFIAKFDFLHHLKIKAWQKREVSIIENGSWAPSAGRVMKQMLEELA